MRESQSSYLDIVPPRASACSKSVTELCPSLLLWFHSFYVLCKSEQATPPAPFGRRCWRTLREDSQSFFWPRYRNRFSPSHLTWHCLRTHWDLVIFLFNAGSNCFVPIQWDWMSSLGCLHKASLPLQKLQAVPNHCVCHSIWPRCSCHTSTSCGFLDFWVECWISRMACEVCNVVIWRALLFVHQLVLDLLFQLLLQKAVTIIERLSKKHVFCLFSVLLGGKQAFLWSFFSKRSFKSSFSSAPAAFHGFLRRNCSLQLENFPFTSCALGAVDLTGLSPNWILPSSLMWGLIMFILNVVVQWIIFKFPHTSRSLAFIQVTLGCWAYLSAGCLTGYFAGGIALLLPDVLLGCLPFCPCCTLLGSKWSLYICSHAYYHLYAETAGEGGYDNFILLLLWVLYVCTK